MLWRFLHIEARTHLFTCLPHLRLFVLCPTHVPKEWLLLVLSKPYHVVTEIQIHLFGSGRMGGCKGGKRLAKADGDGLIDDQALRGDLHRASILDANVCVYAGDKVRTCPGGKSARDKVLTDTFAYT